MDADLRGEWEIEPGQDGQHEAGHIRELFTCLGWWLSQDSDDRSAKTVDRQALVDIDDRWKHARRQRRFQIRSAPAAAAKLLRLADDAAEKMPHRRHGGVRWIAGRGWGPYGALYQQYLDVHKGRDRNDAQRLREATRELRRDVRVVGAELCFRMLDVRSTIHLLRHLKHRCEAFTAAGLRAAVEGVNRKEDVLRDACAAFLYDAGIPVVTEVSIARLRADVIGAPIYIEAKQYSSGTAGVPKAARQVWSTLARLKASPAGSDIRDAYCLIFRLAGAAPLYELPDEPIVFAGFRVYFVLVDIAPAGEAGSQEKHAPRVVTASELLPPTDAQLE